MFRRIVPALPAALLALVVTAGPALADEHSSHHGSRSHSGSSDHGSRSDSQGSQGDDSQSGLDDNGVGIVKIGKDKGAHKKDTKPAATTPSSTPTPAPKATTHAPVPQARTAAPAPVPVVAPTRRSVSTGSSFVRAAAAPATANPTGAPELPAPEPMLLPGPVTEARSAPVDSEHGSSLPAFLPGLLIGGGVLSVAIGGTALARRRYHHPVADSARPSVPA